MKGAFEKRPSIPTKSKTAIWDPQQVLDFLEPWYPHETLSLKDLTLKLTMFLALLSGQRTQTIHSLNINNLNITNDKCIFYVSQILKHSKKGRHQDPIEFLAFTDNKSLCIVDMLKEYLRKTSTIRQNEEKLLISYQSPHQSVSKDTIKRWIKTIMEMAGINTKVFTAHSTRAASTSYAANAGVPMNTILSAAGWSQESTFAKFYKKETKQNFGFKLINAYANKK